jgi:acetolactate synthase-1/2/3 large subunit
MTNYMNVSQYIARFLKVAGVERAFELSGGMIMHLIDCIHQEGGVQLVNVYHEQSAAFAADATGRLSGIPGVAFGTSGPGAINLLTGVGSSFFDSSPAVFITGQVNRHEQKGTREVRQLGFQETDVVSMAKPITKWAYAIRDASEVPECLYRAFSIATSGRPGAVLLDIPMDVFRSPVAESFRAWKPGFRTPDVKLQPDRVEQVVTLLRGAERPLILVGAGVRAAGAHAQFLKFVDRVDIPVVHSLLACDVLPYGHRQRVGMIGTYGNRWANLALSECDFLLVIGSRLDIRQTGADTDSFKRGRTIIHVDVESGEINNRVSDCIPLNCDIRDFLEGMLDCPAVGRPVWERWISDRRREWPDTAELKGVHGINPNVLMHRLSASRDVAAYCVDVGLHQMWAAQSLELGEETRFLTSGGMGAMGFALPAAVGAALHLHGARPVVVIAGDGGFQLNIQELQSIVHHRLPVKIVVANNHCHGMTRQFQDTYFDKRHAGTVWGYSTPAFHRIAEAYGIASMRIENAEQVDVAAEWFWREPLQPCLLEVEIDLTTNAYPKLAFGRPISQMEPLATPLEMEAT